MHQGEQLLVVLSSVQNDVYGICRPQKKNISFIYSITEKHNEQRRKGSLQNQDQMGKKM